MVTSGRKYINIKAPIIKIDEAYVWMDRHWPENFFTWAHEEKFKFTEIKLRKDKLTLYFSTAKECTMFGLKYDKEQQNDIFNNRLQ